MTRPLFVQGLSKRFGGLVATRDVNLELALGQVHAVIGPNGAGKTTLISLLSGLLPADAGTIDFFGQPLQGLSQQERVRAGLVRSFQITSIFSGLSVLENLQVSVQRRRERVAVVASRDEHVAHQLQTVATDDHVGLGLGVHALARALEVDPG